MRRSFRKPIWDLFDSLSFPTASAALVIAFGAYFFIAARSVKSLFSEEPTTKPMDTATLIFLLTPIFVAIIFLMMRYLRIGGGVSGEIRIEELRMRLSKMETQFAEALQQKAGIKDEERENLRRALFSQLTSEGAAQVMKQLQEQVAKLDPHVAPARAVERRHEETLRRLSAEINALGRRSNLNFVLGIMTAFAGLAVLAYVVFGGETAVGEATMTSLLSSYLPRFSLVVFIEIFAYFFLKMYKSNLGEIKYFQN